MFDFAVRLSLAVVYFYFLKHSWILTLKFLGKFSSFILSSSLIFVVFASYFIKINRNEIFIVRLSRCLLFWISFVNVCLWRKKRNIHFSAETSCVSFILSFWNPLQLCNNLCYIISGKLIVWGTRFMRICLLLMS